MGTPCLLNDGERMLSPHNHFHFLLQRLRHGVRNEPRRMLLAMTGWEKKVGNNGRCCQAPLNERRIFGSVPLILMRRPCA
jgi:hypothetical protein